MASVTQTIPNFNGGISQQPDELLFPGQLKDCINALPHPTFGLVKRPGSKRAGTSPLANPVSGGTWFHYYRDESEGSYVGQVAPNGEVRMWRCSDGTQIGVDYDTAGQGGPDSSDPDHTSITNYLTATDSESIQALTINDTTFLTNRTKTISTAGTTDTHPHTHHAFIDLLRSENGRQYSLNIHDPAQAGTTDIDVVTRLKVTDDDLAEGNGTGNCPGIGTQVFSVSTIAKETPPIPESDVDISAVSGDNGECFTVTSHGFVTGDKVYYRRGPDHTSSGTLVGGLTDGTEYYIIKINDNKFRVATSLANANDGTVKTISNDGNDEQYFTTNSNIRSIRNAAGTKLQGAGVRDNLIFRITSLGQQGTSPSANADDSGIDGSGYRCAYNRQITLLNGGEGWAEGDQITVLLDSAQTTYEYEVEVEKIESSPTKITINGGANGAIRPEPTPFDADTAVTADSILGGISAQLAATGLSYEKIGSGIYIYSDSQAFNVTTVDKDIMRVMQSEVNNVGDLPIQCKHGYIIKIANAQMSDEDDYYLKFEGENSVSGSGSWIECPKPGIEKGFNATTMPHILQRQDTNPVKFLIKKATWKDREVGDNISNLIPSFVGKKINKVLFYRNRLALLSDDSVITSRAGDLFNFWANTALTVSPTDPIDIACSSTYPSELFDAIELTAGLLVFSTNQQFLLASDDTIFNPDTAKLRAVSSYNYNKALSPISMGATRAFVDNSGSFSRFMEMADIRRESEPAVVESSKIVANLLPKDLDLITNSRENELVMLGKTGTNTVYLFKYLQVGQDRKQSAWMKWDFNQNLLYHFVVNDQYFYLDSDHFLHSLNLIENSDDITVTDTASDTRYIIHLDNWVSVSGGVWDEDTNVTTFSDQSDWIDQVTSTGNDLVIVDINTANDKIAKYAKCTVIETDNFTVPGNWSAGTLYLGYLYNYQVDLPTLRVTKIQGERISSSTNSSLVIHRLKLRFGKVGLYQTELKRKGKKTYIDTYESTNMEGYSTSAIPYIDEVTKAIPVYEKNENVDISLKSQHPSPATLRSLSWEGEFSPRFYRRV